MKTIYVGKTPLKSVFVDLQRAWRTVDGGDSYQSLRKRLVLPVSIVRENSDIVRDMNALDIGCNNGVMSALLCESFNRVVGIEIKESFCKKAQETKKVFQKLRATGIDNVCYRNQSFKEYVVSGNFNTDGIDAIVSCQVLYHLNNEEIDMFVDKSSQMKWVLATAKPCRSSSSNRFKLYVPAKMKKFLIDCGFNMVRALKKSSRYPVFVARR